ncbi:hypothetical protein [Wolbachia endosymbiont of Dactylopius coccus]
MRILKKAPSVLKKVDRADITYEFASDDGQLTSEGKKKVLKLSKKLEKDKNAVKELEKFSNIQEILMIEIVRKCEWQKERLTLLQHALLYSHKETLEYVIKEAEQYKLFEKIADKKIILECLDGQGNSINKSYSTVIYENSTVQRKTLKPRGETASTVAVGTLTEIELCESSEGAKNFSNIEESRDFDVPENIEKVKGGLQIKQQANITETDTKLCKDTNEYFRPILESKEKTQNASNDLSSTTYFNSGSGKGNFTNEKSSIQPIMAGVVGVVLLLGGIVSYVMEMHTIAVVGMVIGLVCIGFGLHNVLKPDTKLEKVKDIEQSNYPLKAT